MSTGAARCLVTGGGGFIGSHLVERLLSDGHAVTAIDDYSTGHRDNLEHLAGDPNLKVVEADVADEPEIRPHFGGVEWVFHLAARADIVPSIQQPIVYHRANVSGTVAVLEASRSAGVKRFVYAASSSCYGTPEVYPTPETAPIRAMYPYALTKYLGEEYVLHWRRTYGLPALSLRLFNVFGPRSHTTGTYGAVFGVFLAQKLAGKPLTIVGGGEQTRDFTFVTDVVDAFVKAAASDVDGEVCNVGSGGTYSVNRLAGLIGGSITRLPKRPGEPDCTFADTRKIRGLLDWCPAVRFEDGVRIMLDDIESWRAAPVWTPETITDATADWFRYLGENPS